MLVGQGVNPVAGHLLDLNISVGPYISRSLHPLMHDWTSQGDTAKNLTFSILVPMFLRLAMSHEELLADKQALAEAAEGVVKPQQAALVWQFIVGETKPKERTFLVVFFSAMSQLQAHLHGWSAPVFVTSQWHEGVSMKLCACNEPAVYTVMSQSIQTDHV